MDLKKFLFGKLNRKLLIWFLVVSIIPVILVSFILLQNQTTTLTKNTLEIIENEIFSKTLIIEEILEDFRQDILILSENKELEKLINNGDPGESFEDLKENLKIDFFSFSKQKGDYYQIRYIDETGQEIIRIDNDGENISIIPEDKLQNKKVRYYFIETMNLNEGKVFISSLDLNIKGGKLENRGTEEDPIYVPVIRYATPVFKDNGDKKGIIIINVYSNAFLKFVEGSKEGFMGFVINSDDQYIFHPDKEKEFSFMFNDRNYGIGQDYGLIAEEVLKNDEGTIYNGKDNYYLIFKRINLNGDFFVLVSIVDEDILLTEVFRLKKFILVFVIFLVLIVSLLSFLFSRKITQPIEQLSLASEELKKKNFKARVNIKTGDELETLGNTFNQTVQVLEHMDAEHKQLEKAKTEFLSITSHELRSPMTPMQAQLQMLIGEYYGKLNQKQKDSLDIVSRNTKRLDNIIVDFLEISRIEVARLKFRFLKKDLTQYIKRLAKEMTGFMPEKKVKIFTKIGKLPVISVDPDRVMQVLRNLINNAIKFSKEDSSIHVSAKLDKGMILFSVRDEGIGIKSEDQRRLFEPFYQAEQTMYREHHGTGLGLAIIKGIIESQNGRVWLESKVGKGSTFYFTVPLKPIRHIKPIKLLFSAQQDTDIKIKKCFTEILGPMGDQEFETLNNKNQINKKDLIGYINLLKRKGILNQEKAQIFKEKILGLFEEKPKTITTNVLMKKGLIKNDKGTISEKLKKKGLVKE